MKGDITAKRIQIAQTGRVWGSVVTQSFSTDEGAFLKGQITMQDEVDLGYGPEVQEEGTQAEAEGEEREEE
jgi:cytoskeletal protein CcmA (bactofilin family)